MRLPSPRRRWETASLLQVPTRPPGFSRRPAAFQGFHVPGQNHPSASAMTIPATVPHSTARRTATGVKRRCRPTTRGYLPPAPAVVGSKRSARVTLPSRPKRMYAAPAFPAQMPMKPIRRDRASGFASSVSRPQALAWLPKLPSTSISVLPTRMRLKFAAVTPGGQNSPFAPPNPNTTTHSATPTQASRRTPRRPETSRAGQAPGRRFGRRCPPGTTSRASVPEGASSHPPWSRTRWGGPPRFRRRRS